MMPVIDRIVVRASKLRDMGVSLIPQGVKFSKKPINGTKDRLITILRATLSMLSISLVG